MWSRCVHSLNQTGIPMPDRSKAAGVWNISNGRGLILHSPLPFSLSLSMIFVFDSAVAAFYSKGASINDIRKIFGIVWPPPLVRIWFWFYIYYYFYTCFSSILHSFSHFLWTYRNVYKNITQLSHQCTVGFQIIVEYETLFFSCE